MEEQEGNENMSLGAVVTVEPDDLSSDTNTVHRARTDSSSSQILKPRSVGGRRRPTAKLSVNRLRASFNDTMDAFRSIRHTSSVSLVQTPGEEVSRRLDSAHERHARLLEQVEEWLREERTKQSQRTGQSGDEEEAKYDDLEEPGRDGASSRAETEIAIEKLEGIIRANQHHYHRHLHRLHHDLSLRRRRQSSLKVPRLGATPTVGGSDTDYATDGDAVVPSTDAALDNSKTLSYTGGSAGAEAETLDYLRNPGDRDGWYTFKAEILRLAHTLRLKGWRRVPLARGHEIDVQRLSGALTNAVYVVAPPDNLPSSPQPSRTEDELTGPPAPRRPPPKLLLRIYGPQVSHLIDRGKELQILRRLARQNIGPRMLGTFANGRFEQYFDARTLKRDDLRDPATSSHIAKRMRELHDGIALLDEERAGGPVVWCNWDKWAPRCEEVVSWLDEQVQAYGAAGGEASKGIAGGSVALTAAERWKARGLVCGTPWLRFRQAVNAARVWVERQHGANANGQRRALVFAHNDTQYGNLLRLRPPGASPLLLPANEHKQLVVIDFEYAGANARGYEFANHFSEWCYNYHAPPRSSWACAARPMYPRPDEQRRFLSAYVQHRPPTASAAASEGSSATATRPSTAEPTPQLSKSVSVSSFALDARAPPGGCSGLEYAEEERRRDEAVRADVERLVRETRWWRVACSAQWVAWGIVQAKVAGLEAGLAARRQQRHEAMKGPKRVEKKQAGKAGQDERQLDGDEAAPEDKDIVDGEGEDAGEEDEEFDYLAYARDRALFFWGDMLELGLVAEDELPADVVRDAKRVPY